MAKSNLEFIAEQLQKYQGKIITNVMIKNQLQTLLEGEYSESKMYKVIYYLKLRGYLINLKKNLFLVANTKETLDNETIAQKYYWEILNKHCKDFIPWKRYIWWLKALEVALISYTIPEEILLVTPSKQSTETILFEKQALLKTYTNKKKNLFPFFYKLTHKISIGTQKFNIAIPELAILETLYNTSPLQQSYAEELIKKWLRKNKKHVNISVLEQILKENKHNTSLNRLALLCSSIDQSLTENIKSIIKKYGYLLY